MSLEKRQVFPNLFRYVCDSCPFDWPRTPVKESDLPPPPTHACPNENRPDLKVVLEEQERSESTSRVRKNTVRAARCKTQTDTLFGEQPRPKGPSFGKLRLNASPNLDGRPLKGDSKAKRLRVGLECI